MAGGIKDQINRKLTEELLAEPGWAKIFAQAIQNLKEEVYDQELIDAIFQKSSTYDIYDALPFSQVYAAIASGQILVVKIEVCSQPRQDKYVKENDAALQLVSEVGPFYARFHGGQADQDGFFGWTEPIKMERLSDGEAFWIEPHPAPLEVGYTQCYTTFHHLWVERCLARWPYGNGKARGFEFVIESPIEDWRPQVPKGFLTPTEIAEFLMKKYPVD
jgi:hypothetical protein